MHDTHGMKTPILSDILHPISYETP